MRYLPLSLRLPSPPQTVPPIGAMPLTGPASPLLAGVTESLKAGIVLIASDGTIVHANRYAQKLCQQVLSATPTSATRSLTLPAPIHALVQALIESQELFPGYDLILEDEILATEGATVEISARWLKAEPGTPPHILVTLAMPYQNWPRSR